MRAKRHKREGVAVTIDEAGSKIVYWIKQAIFIVSFLSILPLMIISMYHAVMGDLQETIACAIVFVANLFVNSFLEV